jgi:hypothetical protein
MIYSSRKYHTEEHSGQAYISSSQFSSANEDVKQATEWSYENRSTKKTVTSSEPFEGALIAIQDKQQ